MKKDDLSAKNVKKLKALLNEAVKEGLMAEDGDYYYDGMSFYDDSPGGMGGGSGSGRKSVGQIFFDPVKDIAQTAAYAGQYLTTKVKNVAGALISGLVAGLVPYTDKGGKLGVSRAFNHFNEKEVQQLGKLDKTYGTYLQNNIEALKNSDVIGLAFLLNPKVILASKLLASAPGVSLGLLDIITGGSASNLVKSASSAFKYSGDTNLNEQEEGANGVIANSKGLSQALSKLAQDPEFQKKIDNSPVTKKMQADGAKLIMQRLTPLIQSKTLDELSKYVNKDLRASVGDLVRQGKITQQEQPAFEAELLRQTKETIKQQYIKTLEALSQAQPNAANVLQDLVTKITALQ